MPEGIAPARAPAAPQRNPKTLAAYAKGARICKLIKAAATEHGLDPAYFARLIWKESRFDAKALSPKGAQGIAQFMPGTAKLVGLKDPWDPTQAIPASAAHLADLRDELGNWGLAAAGYNAGSGRVWRWLRGRSRLPGETLDYVYSITGEPADFFRERGTPLPKRPLSKGLSFDAACAALPVIRTRASRTAVASSPWGVQVSGNRSRGRAAAQMRRVKARYGRVIGQKRLQLVPKRGPRGTRAIWTGQIAVASRVEAARLCLRLKRAGGDCIIRKN
ncbi:MAG: lytic transglycosylase domain-containing protein [Pseudomonadota bacterium]